MRLYNDKSGNGKGAAFVSQALAKGQFTQPGVGQEAQVVGLYNAELRGNFNGTFRLVRSLDNGATWQPITAAGFPTTFSAPCSESFDEPEVGALIRWECLTLNSGIAYYRISK